MIIDRTNKYNPEPGLPIPNNPKRNTHAKMLSNITFLMPNLRRKNGIVRMNAVSEICDIDISRLGCFTPNESGYEVPKSSRNGPPNALVICKAAPSNIANTKKIIIFLLLNNTKASSPNAASILLFTSTLTGGHLEIVNEYTPKMNPAPALT